MLPWWNKQFHRISSVENFNKTNAIPLCNRTWTETKTKTLHNHRNDQTSRPKANMSHYCFFSSDISNSIPFLPTPRLKVLRGPVIKLLCFLATPIQKIPRPLPCIQIIKDKPTSSIKHLGIPSYPDPPQLSVLRVLLSCSKLQTQL